MYSFDAATESVSTATEGDRDRCDLHAPTEIIEHESDWRLLPHNALSPLPLARIAVTRWRAIEAGTREVHADTAADCHIVSIVLRNQNVRLSESGHLVHDGAVGPGIVHVTGPAVRASGVFRGPYDVLHLHVPHSLIEDFSRDLTGHETGTLCSKAALTRDPVADSLGRALLDAEQIGGSFGQLYAESISTAIVARLLTPVHHADVAERPKVAKLARWRLKRAIDYVEERLGEPVSLVDVAAAAGLTRMHFAAQFKAATGLRPHEYLLRRRIERAQEMLLRTGMSVVDVALSVGFQTQSHFTTVFKRFTGHPPRSWRQSYTEATSSVCVGN